MNIFFKSLHILTNNQKIFNCYFFSCLINILVETLSLGLILPIVALLIDYERLISYEVISNLINFLI